MARNPIRSRRRRSGSVTNPKKPGPGVYLGFGPVLIAGAALGTHLTVLRPRQLGEATFEWPEVPCRILESSVRRKSGSDSHSKHFEVVYEYEVDGRSYQSDRAAFGLHGSTSDQPYEFAQRFPAEAETVCYVDPDDPFDAVLVQGSVAPTWLAFFFLAFAGAGVLMIVEGVRQLLKKRAEAGPASNPETAVP